MDEIGIDLLETKMSELDRRMPLAEDSISDNHSREDQQIEQQSHLMVPVLLLR